MKTCVLIFFCLTWACLADPIKPLDLVDGGYVLYFRHARADVGVDCKDPAQGEWWTSDDSSKTRQLSAAGKQQAQVIGQAFRRLEIPVGLLLCSEFKRARDTTRLMELGEPRVVADLTPLTSLGEIGPRLRPLLAEPPAEGTNTVLVAHGHVLPEFEELEEGSAVVYEPGRPEPVGTIRFQDWAQAAEPLSYESRNEDDRFLLLGSRLTIKSSTGIGEVIVRPLEDQWPELRALRFEYIDGQGMKRLEGLRINTGSPNPRNDYSDFVKSLHDGAVEVALPPELPRSVRFMKIHWVDVYR